ncbi:MAG TPA: hypothetical protein VM452_13850 [Caulifigura sp.]|nr:hypothetical protein [Caulifigura sp.]
MRSFRSWLLAIVAISSQARADYPALEKALAPAIEDAAAQLKDTPVCVAVRNVSGLVPPWKVTAAMQSELVAGLAAKNVAARNAGDDSVLSYLVDETFSFNSKDLERARRNVPGKSLLLGELKRNGQSPALLLTVWDAAGVKGWSKEFPIESADLALDANTPQFNREVLAAASSKFGQWVGNESSWALVADSLKQVGAVRSGTYLYGKELGAGDAWVPGDALLFVGVRFKQEKGKRYSNLSKHSAIVEKINSPNEIEILHQAFNDQPTSRRKLRFDEMQKGYIVAFRPTKDSAEAKQARLRRFRMPEPDTQKDGSVNLLTMVDPRIDALHGVWNRNDGPLELYKEDMAAIQIPYDLPDSYTVTVHAKRVSGTDSIGLGLKVGDSQALIVMDAYDGVSGFHRLGGKRANQNASTKKGRVLEMDQPVELVCQVTPTSVLLKADGKVVIDWNGKANDLSVDEKYTTPEKPWLFLTAHNCNVEITRIKLTSP